MAYMIFNCSVDSCTAVPGLFISRKLTTEKITKGGKFDFDFLLYKCKIMFM